MTRGPIPASYWLVPGRLLAGEYPAAWDESRARERLTAFLDAGIRTFINLTQVREPLDDYASLLAGLAAERAIDVRHIRYEIEDARVPEDPALMSSILATIRDEIDAGRPVYVHCWGGIGRTGTVVGCWLVEEGLDGPAAIARIAELRRHTPDRRRPSPETEEQCRFVCEWEGRQNG